MQRKFLQEKSLNRKFDNAEKSLNVDLSAKSRLIPYSTAASLLGLNDLYLEERDACETYRMIFTVNPVCTNVLYNAVTEPVYLEGSYSALTLVETPISRSGAQFSSVFPDGTLNQSGSSIDQVFAVRDTEISNEKIGGFKYLCGYDIFNNHLLRTNEFEHAKMEESSEHKNRDVFNTIFDFAIDYSGKTVSRIIGESDGPVPDNKPKTDLRMYQIDNIKTMNEAFYDELRNVDGWFGFYNSGYINIPNGKLGGEDISVNRVLNNETPCGFVDLYPDRTLYSFIPKVNRYKKRLERNWDCGIVYPYKNDYDMFNRVMIGFSGTSEEWNEWAVANQSKVPNSVRVLSNKVVYNNVGDELVEFHSLLRHSLEPGDEVRLFYTTSDYADGAYEEIKRFTVPVRVISVGDSVGNNTDRYFTVKMTDINTFCGVYEFTENNRTTKKVCALDANGDVSDDELTFFYRKIEGGCDDKYYFRKFKSLLNYEYEECSENESDEWTTVLRGPSIVGESSPAFIKLGNDYFKKVDRPPVYTQNKIAFATNIYGDRVAQVIFNDDICVSGLLDNLGRPLTTLYFMAIKTNRGHEEWYNSGITSADTVEYSHCFGDVTSGLDLPTATEDFNVRKLYNVFTSQCRSGYDTGLFLILGDAPHNGHYIDDTPLPIESGITMSGFSEFYGDIVEFSRPRFTEKTIEKVYHRFNTAQRECLTNKKYYDIHYDEIVGDLYDVNELQNGQ